MLDKLAMVVVKIAYLSLRIILRIALGKERRYNLYKNRELGYGVFCNKAFKFLKLNHGNNPYGLLLFNSPRYGYQFYCRKNNEDFAFMTFHEDDILKHFTPKEGNNVIDIGAHIGRYTIIASKSINKTGKIVSIEADPANFEILKQNIKLNKLTNVTTLNHAAYSKETKIKLYLPQQESGYTIYNTIMEGRANTKQDRFIEVNANTLDNLLEQNGLNHAEINWIKIDVEGAEFEVLKGATNILSKSKDIAILIEIHNLYGDTNLYTPIIEFLGSYNFKIEYEKKHLGGERHVIVRKSLD